MVFIINLNIQRGIFMIIFVSRVNYSAMNKATTPITREIKCPFLIIFHQAGILFLCNICPFSTIYIHSVISVVVCEFIFSNGQRF